jgi:hypothetical protein
MGKGMKDGMSNSNQVQGIVTFDGTYIYFKFNGTTVARIDTNGTLQINGGLTDNAGI